jgi:hypothetical protein
VVRYAGDSEERDNSGDRVVAWVALGASTGKGVKICWKQLDLRDTLASGFAAAEIDDGFVRAQPALDGMGWLLKKLSEGF